MKYTIQNNKNLKELNTFSIEAKAKEFIEIPNIDSLIEALNDSAIKKEKKLVLGGGSNILFSKDFPGVVLKCNLQGVTIIEEDKDNVIVDVQAGESWMDFVIYAVDKGWSGLENLAYIPGQVGGAVVQNIGAYGQSLEDIFVEAEAVDLDTGLTRTFSKADCEFGYRTTAFKSKHLGKVFVIKARFKLSKTPVFDTEYHSRFARESLAAWLEKSAKPPYSPKDVANAVTNLRKFKLPDLAEYGSCGSFFVNPVVSIDKYKELAGMIPELQSYPIEKLQYNRHEWDNTEGIEMVKIPAGRLLDEAGWAGKWIGNVGTFKKDGAVNALCVITNKNATGAEVKAYTDMMKKDVWDKYGVELVSEIVLF